MNEENVYPDRNVPSYIDLKEAEDRLKLIEEASKKRNQLPEVNERDIKLAAQLLVRQTELFLRDPF